jgi:hypothetical protein
MPLKVEAKPVKAGASPLGCVASDKELNHTKKTNNQREFVVA